jgi:(p)ppGpp synthase/HD superfamily hydrolase
LTEHAAAIPAILDALDFAAVRHRDQRRKGNEASPYINHPIQVARILAGPGGVRDVDVLIAALLHDTIEDTVTTADELSTRFGARVRSLVEEVTDDKRLPNRERKRLQIEHASQLSLAARQIKIADKISNVRDVAGAPPRGWSIERRTEYVEWADAVVQRCKGANPFLDHLWDETVTRARTLMGEATASPETGESS